MFRGVSGVAVLLGLMAIGLLWQIGPAWALPTLSALPSPVGASPNAQFTVTIQVAQVTNLVAYDITLNYNSAILNALSATADGTLFATSGFNYYVFKSEFSPGRISYAVSELAGAIGTSSPATGPILFITFKALAAGTSSLDINQDTLADSNAQNIPHTTVDGTFDNTHNVGITSLVPVKTVIGQGQSGDILVNVKNLGLYSEQVTVRAFAGASQIGSSIITLAAGASNQVRYTWNTQGFTRATYSITATVSITSSELALSDNSASGGSVKVTIQGDIDGNGVVNLDDVLIVNVAWGGIPGSPNWNPNADVDNNQIVDLDDVLFVIVRWS